MDYSKLDSYMSITKKADTSQAKKMAYQTEMVKLFEEEGYSGNAEKYLFEGFSSGGMNAFAEYINTKTVLEKKEFYHRFTSGNKFNNNDKGLSFKMMTALLGLLINQKELDLNIIQDVITRFNGLSKNKENKRWGDAVKTVEKYFINALTPEVNLPDFSLMELKSAAIKGFKDVMIELINGLELSHMKDNMVVKKMMLWIGYNSSINDGLISLGSYNTEQEKTKTEDENFVQKEKVRNETENNMTISQQLISIASYLDRLEKEKDSLKKNFDYFRQGNQCLSAKADQLTWDLEKARATLKDVEEQKEIFKQEIFILDKENESKNTQIEKMSNEIKTINAVISVFESEKKNSLQEQLNGIASKLKTEYQDFKDAINMETTVDPGENMRQQLLSIFKILIKNGIDIEGR